LGLQESQKTTGNNHLKLCINDVMDAADRFEDNVSSNKHHWSEGLHLENIERALKKAVSYYKENGEFGPYTGLVEAVTNGTPIYRNHMGYGTSIGFVLFDNIISIIQNVVEMLFKPIITAKRQFLLKLNKKYNASSETLISSLVLDGNGEASFVIERDLASDSDEQLVMLKHPSKIKYEFDSAPSVSVSFSDGRNKELKTSFQGYRTIGYKVKNTEGIIRISVKGNPTEYFQVVWIDSLYPKR
jgi:hypothetical protein